MAKGSSLCGSVLAIAKYLWPICPRGIEGLPGARTRGAENGRHNSFWRAATAPSAPPRGALRAPA